MFLKAGFMDFVKPDRDISSKLNEDVWGKLIHKLKRDEVEGPLAGRICLSAMEHTYGSKDFSKQNFYPILVECMANTHNHAGDRLQECNWWLLAYKEPETKITKFCFLDLGMGIFESLRKKYGKGSIPDKLKFYDPAASNKKTITQIFSGVKKTSTTGQQGRGEGLGYIYRLVKKDKTIGKFTLLSNNVTVKIGYNANDIVKSLQPDFEGTMYYWELLPNHD